MSSDTPHTPPLLGELHHCRKPSANLPTMALLRELSSCQHKMMPTAAASNNNSVTNSQQQRQSKNITSVLGKKDGGANEDGNKQNMSSRQQQQQQSKESTKMRTPEKKFVPVAPQFFPLTQDVDKGSPVWMQSSAASSSSSAATTTPSQTIPPAAQQPFAPPFSTSPSQQQQQPQQNMPARASSRSNLRQHHHYHPTAAPTPMMAPAHRAAAAPLVSLAFKSTIVTVMFDMGSSVFRACRNVQDSFRNSLKLVCESIRMQPQFQQQQQQQQQRAAAPFCSSYSTVGGGVGAGTTDSAAPTATTAAPSASSSSTATGRGGGGGRFRGSLPLPPASTTTASGCATSCPSSFPSSPAAAAAAGSATAPAASSTTTALPAFLMNPSVLIEIIATNVPDQTQVQGALSSTYQTTTYAHVLEDYPIGRSVALWPPTELEYFESNHCIDVVMDNFAAIERQARQLLMLSSASCVGIEYPEFDPVRAVATAIAVSPTSRSRERLGSIVVVADFTTHSRYDTPDLSSLEMFFSQKSIQLTLIDVRETSGLSSSAADSKEEASCHKVCAGVALRPAYLNTMLQSVQGRSPVFSLPELLGKKKSSVSVANNNTNNDNNPKMLLAQLGLCLTTVMRRSTVRVSRCVSTKPLTLLKGTSSFSFDIRKCKPEYAVMFFSHIYALRGWRVDVEAPTTTTADGAAATPPPSPPPLAPLPHNARMTKIIRQREGTIGFAITLVLSVDENSHTATLVKQFSFSAEPRLLQWLRTVSDHHSAGTMHLVMHTPGSRNVFVLRSSIEDIDDLLVRFLIQPDEAEVPTSSASVTKLGHHHASKEGRLSALWALSSYGGLVLPMTAACKVRTMTFVVQNDAHILRKAGSSSSLPPASGSSAAPVAALLQRGVVSKNTIVDQQQQQLLQPVPSTSGIGERSASNLSSGSFFSPAGVGASAEQQQQQQQQQQPTNTTATTSEFLLPGGVHALSHIERILTSSRYCNRNCVWTTISVNPPSSSQQTTTTGEEDTAAAPPPPPPPPPQQQHISPAPANDPFEYRSFYARPILRSSSSVSTEQQQQQRDAAEAATTDAARESGVSNDDANDVAARPTVFLQVFQRKDFAPPPSLFAASAGTAGGGGGGGGATVNPEASVPSSALASPLVSQFSSSVAGGLSDMASHQQHQQQHAVSSPFDQQAPPVPTAASSISVAYPLHLRIIMPGIFDDEVLDFVYTTVRDAIMTHFPLKNMCSKTDEHGCPSSSFAAPDEDATAEPTSSKQLQAAPPAATLDLLQDQRIELTLHRIAGARNVHTADHSLATRNIRASLVSELPFLVGAISQATTSAYTFVFPLEGAAVERTPPLGRLMVPRLVSNLGAKIILSHLHFQSSAFVSLHRRTDRVNNKKELWFVQRIPNKVIRISILVMNVVDESCEPLAAPFSPAAAAASAGGGRAVPQTPAVPGPSLGGAAADSEFPELSPLRSPLSTPKGEITFARAAGEFVPSTDFIEWSARHLCLAKTLNELNAIACETWPANTPNPTSRDIPRFSFPQLQGHANVDVVFCLPLLISCLQLAAPSSSSSSHQVAPPPSPKRQQQEERQQQPAATVAPLNAVLEKVMPLSPDMFSLLRQPQLKHTIKQSLMALHSSVKHGSAGTWTVHVSKLPSSLTSLDEYKQVVPSQCAQVMIACFPKDILHSSSSSSSAPSFRTGQQQQQQQWQQHYGAAAPGSQVAHADSRDFTIGILPLFPSNDPQDQLLFSTTTQTKSFKMLLVNVSPQQIYQSIVDKQCDGLTIRGWSDWATAMDLSGTSGSSAAAHHQQQQQQQQQQPQPHMLDADPECSLASSFSGQSGLNASLRGASTSGSSRTMVHCERAEKIWSTASDLIQSMFTISLFQAQAQKLQQQQQQQQQQSRPLQQPATVAPTLPASPVTPSSAGKAATAPVPPLTAAADDYVACGQSALKHNIKYWDYVDESVDLDFVQACVECLLKTETSSSSSHRHQQQIQAHERQDQQDQLHQTLSLAGDSECGDVNVDGSSMPQQQAKKLARHESMVSAVSNSTNKQSVSGASAGATVTTNKSSVMAEFASQFALAVETIQEHQRPSQEQPSSSSQSPQWQVLRKFSEEALSLREDAAEVPTTAAHQQQHRHSSNLSATTTRMPSFSHGVLLPKRTSSSSSAGFTFKTDKQAGPAIFLYPPAVASFGVDLVTDTTTTVTTTTVVNTATTISSTTNIATPERSASPSSSSSLANESLSVQSTTSTQPPSAAPPAEEAAAAPQDTPTTTTTTTTTSVATSNSRKVEASVNSITAHSSAESGETPVVLDALADILQNASRRTSTDSNTTTSTDTKTTVENETSQQQQQQQQEDTKLKAGAGEEAGEGSSTTEHAPPPTTTTTTTTITTTVTTTTTTVASESVHHRRLLLKTCYAIVPPSHAEATVSSSSGDLFINDGAIKKLIAQATATNTIAASPVEEGATPSSSGGGAAIVAPTAKLLVASINTFIQDALAKICLNECVKRCVVVLKQHQPRSSSSRAPSMSLLTRRSSSRVGGQQSVAGGGGGGVAAASSSFYSAAGMTLGDGIRSSTSNSEQHTPDRHMLPPLSSSSSARGGGGGGGGGAGGDAPSLMLDENEDNNSSGAAISMSRMMSSNLDGDADVDTPQHRLATAEGFSVAAAADATAANADTTGAAAEVVPNAVQPQQTQQQQITPIKVTPIKPNGEPATATTTGSAGGAAAGAVGGGAQLPPPFPGAEGSVPGAAAAAVSASTTLAVASGGPSSSSMNVSSDTSSGSSPTKQQQQQQQQNTSTATMTTNGSVADLSTPPNTNVTMSPPPKSPSTYSFSMNPVEGGGGGGGGASALGGVGGIASGGSFGDMTNPTLPHDGAAAAAPLPLQSSQQQQQRPEGAVEDDLGDIDEQMGSSLRRAQQQQHHQRRSSATFIWKHTADSAIPAAVVAAIQATTANNISALQNHTFILPQFLGPVVVVVAKKSTTITTTGESSAQQQLVLNWVRGAIDPQGAKEEEERDRQQHHQRQSASNAICQTPTKKPSTERSSSSSPMSLTLSPSVDAQRLSPNAQHLLQQQRREASAANADVAAGSGGGGGADDHSSSSPTANASLRGREEDDDKSDSDDDEVTSMMGDEMTLNHNDGSCPAVVVPSFTLIPPSSSSLSSVPTPPLSNSGALVVPAQNSPRIVASSASSFCGYEATFVNETALWVRCSSVPVVMFVLWAPAPASDNTSKDQQQHYTKNSNNNSKLVLHAFAFGPDAHVDKLVAALRLREQLRHKPPPPPPPQQQQQDQQPSRLCSTTTLPPSAITPPGAAAAGQHSPLPEQQATAVTPLPVAVAVVADDVPVVSALPTANMSVAPTPHREMLLQQEQQPPPLPPSHSDGTSATTNQQLHQQSRLNSSTTTVSSRGGGGGRGGDDDDEAAAAAAAASPSWSVEDQVDTVLQAVRERIFSFIQRQLVARLRDQRECDVMLLPPNTVIGGSGGDQDNTSEEEEKICAPPPNTAAITGSYTCPSRTEEVGMYLDAGALPEVEAEIAEVLQLRRIPKMRQWYMMPDIKVVAVGSVAGTSAGGIGSPVAAAAAPTATTPMTSSVVDPLMSVVYFTSTSRKLPSTQEQQLLASPHPAAAAGGGGGGVGTATTTTATTLVVSSPNAPVSPGAFPTPGGAATATPAVMEEVPIYALALQFFSLPFIHHATTTEQSSRCCVAAGGAKTVATTNSASPTPAVMMQQDTSELAAEVRTAAHNAVVEYMYQKKSLTKRQLTDVFFAHKLGRYTTGLKTTTTREIKMLRDLMERNAAFSELKLVIIDEPDMTSLVFCKYRDKVAFSVSIDVDPTTANQQQQQIHRQGSVSSSAGGGNNNNDASATMIESTCLCKFFSSSRGDPQQHEASASSVVTGAAAMSTFSYHHQKAAAADEEEEQAASNAMSNHWFPKTVRDRVVSRALAELQLIQALRDLMANHTASADATAATSSALSEASCSPSPSSSTMPLSCRALLDEDAWSAAHTPGVSIQDATVRHQVYAQDKFGPLTLNKILSKIIIGWKRHFDAAVQKNLLSASDSNNNNNNSIVMKRIGNIVFCAFSVKTTFSCASACVFAKIVADGAVQVYSLRELGLLGDDSVFPALLTHVKEAIDTHKEEGRGRQAETLKLLGLPLNPNVVRPFLGRMTTKPAIDFQLLDFVSLTASMVDSVISGASHQDDDRVASEDIRKWKEQWATTVVLGASTTSIPISTHSSWNSYLTCPSLDTKLVCVSYAESITSEGEIFDKLTSALMYRQFAVIRTKQQQQQQCGDAGATGGGGGGALSAFSDEVICIRLEVTGGSPADAAGGGGGGAGGFGSTTASSVASALATLGRSGSSGNEATATPVHGSSGNNKTLPSAIIVVRMHTSRLSPIESQLTIQVQCLNLGFETSPGSSSLPSASAASQQTASELFEFLRTTVVSMMLHFRLKAVEAITRAMEHQSNDEDSGSSGNITTSSAGDASTTTGGGGGGGAGGAGTPGGGGGAGVADSVAAGATTTTTSTNTSSAASLLQQHHSKQLWLLRMNLERCFDGGTLPVQGSTKSALVAAPNGSGLFRLVLSNEDARMLKDNNNNKNNTSSSTTSKSQGVTRSSSSPGSPSAAAASNNDNQHTLPSGEARAHPSGIEVLGIWSDTTYLEKTAIGKAFPDMTLFLLRESRPVFGGRGAAGDIGGGANASSSSSSSSSSSPLSTVVTLYGVNNTRGSPFRAPEEGEVDLALLPFRYWRKLSRVDKLTPTSVMELLNKFVCSTNVFAMVSRICRKAMDQDSTLFFALLKDMAQITSSSSNKAVLTLSSSSGAAGKKTACPECFVSSALSSSPHATAHLKLRLFGRKFWLLEQQTTLQALTTAATGNAENNDNNIMDDENSGGDQQQKKQQQQQQQQQQQCQLRALIVVPQEGTLPSHFACLFFQRFNQQTLGSGGRGEGGGGRQHSRNPSSGSAISASQLDDDSSSASTVYSSSNMWRLLENQCVVCRNRAPSSSSSSASGRGNSPPQPVISALAATTGSTGGGGGGSGHATASSSAAATPSVSPANVVGGSGQLSAALAKSDEGETVEAITRFLFAVSTAFALKTMKKR